VNTLIIGWALPAAHAVRSYAHEALGAGPVSASIVNAGLRFVRPQVTLRQDGQTDAYSSSSVK
jgi:hypothetical protein